jgi:hypothetical protein
MTGFKSKKAAALDKLNDDDDTQVYGDALTIAYQSGYYDGKKAAQPTQRPWVSLTDDEIKEIVGPWGDTPIKGYTRKLFDQIEAKLREKNT